MRYRAMVGGRGNIWDFDLSISRFTNPPDRFEQIYRSWPETTLTTTDPEIVSPALYGILIEPLVFADRAGAQCIGSTDAHGEGRF